MATGDAAAAAGIPVVAQTADARLGYNDINAVADAIGNHMLTGGHEFGKITGTITTGQIGNAAVTTVKIADANVTTAKIAASAVTLAKMAANSVGSSQIVALAVTTGKIADSAVTAVKLATDSVTTVKIADDSVTNAKIGPLAVGNTEIAAGAVSGSKLADGSVATNKLQDGSVTDDKIASGAVTGPKLDSSLERTGSWSIEADTMTIGDSTGTDKATFGGGFDVRTNQDGDIHADGTLSLDGTAKVEITSDHSLSIDASTNMAISSGGSSSLVLDAGGVLALRGGTGEITVGGGGVNSPTIYGDTTSSAANVVVQSDGQLRRSTSSRRYKDDIRSAEPMPAVLDIEPRVWADKNDPARLRQFGAIAEELDELGLTDLVVYVNDEPEAIAYDRIVIALIPLVRDLATRVAALEAAPDTTED